MSFFYACQAAKGMSSSAQFTQFRWNSSSHLILPQQFYVIARKWVSNSQLCCKVWLRLRRVYLEQVLQIIKFTSSRLPKCARSLWYGNHMIFETFQQLMACFVLHSILPKRRKKLICILQWFLCLLTLLKYRVVNLRPFINRIAWLICIYLIIIYIYITFLVWKISFYKFIKYNKRQQTMSDKLVFLKTLQNILQLL